MKRIMLCFASAAAMTANAMQANACEQRSIRIEGHSLAPRIAHGATVEVEIGVDCLFTPKRGEVVLFASGALDIPIAKEVVGLPNDRWGISDAGAVVVNGKRATNGQGKPYRLNAARMRMLKLYEKEYDGVMPPNTYLLMGEPTTGSLDSSRLGLIHRQDIIGRVVDE